MKEPFRLRTKDLPYALLCRPNSSDIRSFGQVFVDHEYAPLDDIRDPELIIDCGAYVGYSAAYFLSRFRKACVVAVEPDLENVRILETNLRPWQDRVRIVHSAIWSHATGLLFSRSSVVEGQEWSRQLRESQPGETPEIMATDIATLLDESNCKSISLLKMDIEGAERVVFSENYASWIDRVDNIAIELHDEECAAAFLNAVSSIPFGLCRSGELTICKRETTPQTAVRGS